MKRPVFHISSNRWINLRLLALALAGGLMLSLAWPPHLFFILLFAGFVPFFWIEEIIASRQLSMPVLRLFGFSFSGFLVWNGLSVWWLWIATPAGAVFAIVANSIFMALPFLLFRFSKIHLGESRAFIAFIAYWIAYEFLHHNWELAWTWLSLGNGLARFPQLIQWYSWTGIFGGTLWILGFNVLLFRVMRRQYWYHLLWKEKPNTELRKERIFRFWFGLFKLGMVLMVPVILSLIQFNAYTEKGATAEVVAVQPNVDPYEEKFEDSPGFVPYAKQYQRLADLSEGAMTDQTMFVVWPETALPGGNMDIRHIDESWQGQKMRELLEPQPGVSLVTGINGLEIQDENSRSATSRPYPGREGVYVDVFNTALFMQYGGKPMYYHKSKLVPGVERTPYPGLFKFLNKYSIDMGGISGSLGMQDERTVFTNQQGMSVAPVICFESVFGEYVGGFIRNGAEAIFVITNDGWWGTTAGHRQHLYFSTLRAIENRRDVVRSANTGISCFIDQKGIIRHATPYGVPGAIRDNIHLNKEQTFYSRFGDVIGRLALLIAAFFALFSLAGKFTHRFQNRVRKF